MSVQASVRLVRIIIDFINDRCVSNKHRNVSLNGTFFVNPSSPPIIKTQCSPGGRKFLLVRPTQDFRDITNVLVRSSYCGHLDISAILTSPLVFVISRFQCIYIYLLVCSEFIEETGQYPKLIFGILLALFNEFWFLGQNSNFSLRYDVILTFPKL